MNTYEQDELAQLIVRACSKRFEEGRLVGLALPDVDGRLKAAADAEQAMREVWLALYGLRVEGRP